MGPRFSATSSPLLQNVSVSGGQEWAQLIQVSNLGGIR